MSLVPFSQACENNKAPILEVISQVFSTSKCVLEIGTGTGQHAVHFAQALPHLTWQTSDQVCYLDGINAQLKQARSLGDQNTDPIANIQSPLILDVTQPWPLASHQTEIDGIFTANTLHIMAKDMVEAFFIGVGKHLRTQGNLCIYGPFNYADNYTSESNARFDTWLAQQDPRSAIRDIEWIVQLAETQGLRLIEDHTMPANNRLLHFEKNK
ncbi:DUF938 domain-containing protein [Shewanella psychropiezotolerans]|uniref:DUF938 domain-containing protein n=1 Tax=Shewanella psychropiezotolerans TaxID=2593655 RepID=A0ABX5WZU2_9GAMM|nr:MULTISPECIES: DUF938 domain-containing protein [Shewanella]MPY26222.1 DUF938 domain-containing protein [Shewanella sp. YLB-07]QDO84619.1 DUF938 domain-containing protein [Shewanella psychropiezotolerans]